MSVSECYLSPMVERGSKSCGVDEGRRAFLLGAVALMIVSPEPAAAQTQQQMRRMRRRLRRGGRQMGRARRAVREGLAKPLFDIIKQVEAKTGAQILDAHYRERGPARVYILSALHSDGQFELLVVDALAVQIFTPREASRHYGFRQFNR